MAGRVAMFVLFAGFALACSQDDSSSDDAKAASVACDPLTNAPDGGMRYAATTLDGHRFYAFEASNAPGFRVFYGTPDRVVERRVASATRTPNGDLSIVVDIEGTQAKALLFFCPATAGPSRLEPAGGPTIPLTPLPHSAWDCSTRPETLVLPRALVEDVSFLCF